MPTNHILFSLQERFSAPLPEFHQRRIIFWHDEDREFEAEVDGLELPGVNIVKLTGMNNFAVKKLLLHDDLEGNYLIYDPFSHEKPQDNWLRDIERFSEEFRADYWSLLMSDLAIDPKPVMRKVVKQYGVFFGNKERVAKLKRIGRSYESPLQLQVDIMAVLAGLPGGSAQDVIIAVLSGGLDEENNAALNSIKQYGRIEAFWQLIQKCTGYVYDEEKPLGFMAAHILMTALAQTMKKSDAMKGLERFVSESNTAYCYSIVHEWRGREDNSTLYSVCRTVERELNLRARFEKMDLEVLLTGDVFPAIHEVILKRLFDQVAEQMVQTDLFLRTAENRRTSGWAERFSDYYDCLYYIAKMQEFYQANAGGFHIVEPKAVWRLYTETAYEMDSLYRRFHFAYSSSLQASNARLEDSLKHAVDYVEGLYQNWFLKELSACWLNAAGDEMEKLGYVSELPKQRDFYLHYIQPLAGKANRAFVIVSDALRYETAMELTEAITRSTRGTAKVESMQSVFPSITKFGMAALLPKRELSVNDNMDVLADGLQTRNTAEREKVLCKAAPNSVAVQYEDVLTMKRAARRELVSGKNVVYIYYNTIDATGDKAPTEKKVFDACSDAIKELSTLVRIIVSDMQGTDIFITADHGFLYTYSPLAESDKVSKSAFSDAPYEVGRRYALTSPETTADFLLPVQMGQITGAPVKGFTPRDTTRIKIAGGGSNYVHGGISLQEMTVPVVVFKNLRSSSKKYVEVSNAELTLLSESRKISNLMFSLDFFQKQPVGEKVQPCMYSIYMTDDEGRIVSDRQQVIADRTNTTDAERVFRVRFNLKAGAYDSKKVYRLVITNEADIPEEIEFHIDIAFADDFGFDF